MKKLTLICSLLVSQLQQAQQFHHHTAIDSILNQKITKAKIPGLAAAILQNNNIYYGVGGTISNKSKDLITHKTLFHIGSNTKAFSSFLAFQAIEKGNLSLETSFFSLFPELKSDANSAYHSITLKELLSHNAQVQPFTSGLESNQIKITKETVSDKRIEFAQQLLLLPQVEKGTYSNAGYVIASMMIEKAEEIPFEDLLQQYLNNQNWQFSFGFPNRIDENNAWGHWKEFFILKALPPNHSYSLPDYMLAAGDLSMNITDYAQWLVQHLNGLQSKDPENAYQKMHYDLANYSYGWGNTTQNNQKMSFHDGSTGTFYTHAILAPDRQIGLIIFANAAEEEHVKAIYQLQQELFAYLKSVVNGNNS